MDYGKWIADNLELIIQIIFFGGTGLVTLASMIVKLTKRTSDDEFVTKWGSWLMKIIEVISMKKK